jgi:hypothetical protein
VGAAERGEVGGELVPGQDGQAGRSLEDRDEGAVAMDGQDGDGAVARVAAEATRPRQRGTQGRRRLVRVAPEPLDESFEGVPGQPDFTVITLSRGEHGIAID